MIDGKYRTIADRKHRATVGFSMGGGQAGRFGLRHLETFSQVGIMSAGTAAGEGGEPFATLAPNRDKTNKLIDLLWIACGTDDTAIKGARTLHQSLDKPASNTHTSKPKARIIGASGDAISATCRHCCSRRLVVLRRRPANTDGKTHQVYLLRVAWYRGRVADVAPLLQGVRAALVPVISLVGPGRPPAHRRPRAAGVARARDPRGPARPRRSILSPDF